jgi:hypothetical protein
MRPLTSLELLNVWERGFSEKPARRALLLLAAASPEECMDDLARISIGKRDDRLLTLRDWMFGSRLTCLAECVRCSAQLESTLTVEQIRARSDVETADTHQLTTSEFTLTFRVPNTMDVQAIENCADGVSAREKLLDRCVLETTRQGEAIARTQLPDDIVAELLSRMERADPQADIRVSLECPACRHRWESTFDIVSFLWKEIHAWATRLLREVDKLARVYGWRELDIVSMSPLRRRLYLEMVSS